MRSDMLNWKFNRKTEEDEEEKDLKLINLNRFHRSLFVADTARQGSRRDVYENVLFSSMETAMSFKET